jgi:Tfp pilus assembly protein PilF
LKNTIIIGLLITLLFGCINQTKQPVIAPNDYDKFLSTKGVSSQNQVLNEIRFWSTRLDKDSTKTIELGKLSSLYLKLFSATGDVLNLYKSETLLKKAIKFSAREKDSYLRALAQNYISQHRFKEAKQLLDSAYTFPDNKRETELLLFDINMELANYSIADEFLGKVKNNNDYNYLIRLSKWSDYKGNLDAAIRYMNQAMSKAESSGRPSLMIWTYTNIGDYYTHAGSIKDAYLHYLKALELQPDNVHAKKGIAQIAYAYENNTIEANRILDSIMSYHISPDYFFMKAEMAEFNNDISEKEKQIDSFIDAISERNYGSMYSTYLIKLFAIRDPERALAIAIQELTNRATPEIYQLLAFAQVKNGMKEEALFTIESHVEGKTFEPISYYYQGLVYKANDMENRIPDLKRELLNHPFELGPVLIRELNGW